MRLRTADISVIFVSRGTKRRCGACVHAATHTNNEISLPQDNTVMHAWPDSVTPTASPAESYTPNNCYRGKLHVPCVPLRNSAVTLLSFARNTHYGLRIIRASFFLQRTCDALSTQNCRRLRSVRLLTPTKSKAAAKAGQPRRGSSRIRFACVISESNKYEYAAWCMYLDELHVQNDNSVKRYHQICIHLISFYLSFISCSFWEHCTVTPEAILYSWSVLISRPSSSVLKC